MLFRNILLLFLSMSLMSCVIEVKDFGEMWKSGYVDTKLIGAWDGYNEKDGQKERIPVFDFRVTEKSGEYDIKTREDHYHGVTISHGNITFLAFKKIGQGKEGGLVMYEYQDDEFVARLCGDSWNGNDVTVQVLTAEIMPKLINYLKDGKLCEPAFRFSRR